PPPAAWPPILPTTPRSAACSPHHPHLDVTSDLLGFGALMLNMRWKVFRGDSTCRRDLMFSVIAFLASNDAEQACDFRITSSYHDGACAVSLGDSDT
ncbi:hypothetical protein ACJX0J_024348, partial [Zea mays]